MKAALIALVLTPITPSHIRFAVFGCPVSLSVGVLIAAAEGFDRGWDQGYAKGFPDGIAACPRNPSR